MRRSLQVTPRTSPKRRLCTSVAKDRLFEMITTPRASIPTNSRPTAVSSARRARRFTNVMPPTITAAVARAPRVRSNPHSTARAMPGMTPWARASPRKDRPRSTTQVPTTEDATTASIPAHSARCMNSAAKGSVSQSTASACQGFARSAGEGGGDAVGAGADHAEIGLGPAAVRAERLGVQLDHLHVRALGGEGVSQAGRCGGLGEDGRHARLLDGLGQGLEVGRAGFGEGAAAGDDHAEDLEAEPVGEQAEHLVVG